MDDEIQELSTNEVLAGVKVPDSVPKIPAPDTDTTSQARVFIPPQGLRQRHWSRDHPDSGSYLIAASFAI